MGQHVDRASQQLLAGLTNEPTPVLKTINRKQKLPEGVEKVFSHKFESSGNSLALFRIEKDGIVTYRVTTVFSDGTIVREELQKWELARKLMGRKPREESNG